MTLLDTVCPLALVLLVSVVESGCWWTLSFLVDVNVIDLENLHLQPSDVETTGAPSVASWCRNRRAAMTFLAWNPK